KQDARKTIDRAERRPEVMRDRVCESFQFFVGSLPERGSLDDAPFQILVEAANLFFSLLAFRDIGAGTDPLADGAVGLQDWNAVDDHIPILTVVAAQAILGVVEAAVLDGARPDVNGAFAV